LILSASNAPDSHLKCPIQRRDGSYTVNGFFDYGKPLANGGAPPDEVLIERIIALGPAYAVAASLGALWCGAREHRFV
jgi:hypothetical protein